VGSKTYDFLNNSFLFDDSYIDSEFEGILERDMQKELQRYREFCISVEAELEREILSDDSSLKLFSGVQEPDISVLKQSALYVHQHILYDPLFAVTEPPNNLTKAFNKLFGADDGSIDKRKVARIIHYLKELTPMVAADYVKFLPTSFMFELPLEVPIEASNNFFEECIPPTLRQFMYDNVIVRSVTTLENGYIRFEDKLRACRHIAVNFKDHYTDRAQFWVLTPQRKVVSADKESGVIHLEIPLSDTQPDRETFLSWVHQSVNQTAGDIYRRLLLENMFSSKFKAFYMTDSAFIFRLLGELIPANDGSQSEIVNTLLKMDVSFLDGMDSEILMRIRLQEGEAFENFRLELDKHLRYLRGIENPNVLQVKAEDVMHELIEVEIPRVNKQMGYLRKRLFLDAAILAASLYCTVQSGGLSLPVALGAGLQVYRSVADYQRHKRENPAFFLWRVLGNA
jgi:hypothetical protein